LPLEPLPVGSAEPGALLVPFGVEVGETLTDRVFDVIDQLAHLTGQDPDALHAEAVLQADEIVDAGGIVPPEAIEDEDPRGTLTTAIDSHT
jgi:hypothetical protein